MLQLLTPTRPIPGFEGLYSATADGRIWSHGRMVQEQRRTRRIPADWLMPMTDRLGYGRVNLYCDGKKHRWLVHRLIALAFLGPPPPGRDVINHKDLDPSNNHFTNLEWCSVGENNQHAWNSRPERVVPAKLLEAHQVAVRDLRKLTEGQVRFLRKRRAAGATYQSLAEEFNVSLATARNAAIRITYAHVI